MGKRDIEFAKTQITLIESIAQVGPGRDERLWNRFFDMYYPAMVKYAELFCGAQDAEDIVQDVLAKLADVLRSGRYVRRPGTRFSAYLKTLIRNKFIDWRRREAARGLGRAVPADLANEAPAAPDAAAWLDAEWRIAARAAAVDRVLSKMAMPEKMRRAYRGYVVEGRPPGEVAKELGVGRAYVVMSKFRVNARVRAVEAMYEE